jgi:hypothetical protein
MTAAIPETTGMDEAGEPIGCWIAPVGREAVYEAVGLIGAEARFTGYAVFPTMGLYV